MPQDSAGRFIDVGDTVRFRGKEFTIESFGPKTGRCDTHTITFTEPVTHTTEIPDEISIDKVY